MLDTTGIVGIGIRGGAAVAAYKLLGSKVPGGPIVAALLAWIVTDLLLDRAKV